MKNILKSFLLLALGLSYGPSAIPEDHIYGTVVTPAFKGCDLLGRSYRGGKDEYLVIKSGQLSIQVFHSIIQSNPIMEFAENVYALLTDPKLKDGYNLASQQNFMTSRTELENMPGPFNFLQTKSLTYASNDRAWVFKVEDLEGACIVHEVLSLMSKLEILPRFNLENSQIRAVEFSEELPKLLAIIVQSYKDSNGIDYDSNPIFRVPEFYDAITYKQSDKILLNILKEAFNFFNENLISVTFNGHPAHLGINLLRIYHGFDEDLKRILPAGLLFKAIHFVTSSPEASSISSSQDLEQRILDKFIEYIQSHIEPDWTLL